MRILLAETSFYHSFHGEAIFTKNLAEQLVKRGHEVSVVVNSESGRAEQEIHNGVRIYGLSTFSLRLFHPNAALPFFPRPAVERLFKHIRPEIVHIQDHYPVSRDVLLAARRRKIKTVGTNHFMPENLAPYFPLVSDIKWLFDGVLWGMMREVYDRLDGVAAPSRTAADLVRSRGLKPEVVPISCGVDVSLFQPDPAADRERVCKDYGMDPRSRHIFFVGRIDREKRLDVIVRALKVLARPDLQFVIAGNGTVAGEIQSLAEQLGLGDRVVFTGFIPNEDLPTVLSSIDLFVMPSQAELLSIATLEAMACARPVIAARAVALPELVSDDVNGYLFNPGEVEDAARQIARLLDQPGRWQAMGQVSLERARLHSLENTTAHYDDFYQAVLAGASLAEFAQGRPARLQKRSETPGA